MNKLLMMALILLTQQVMASGLPETSVNHTDGIAVQGIDVVNYFVANEPALGVKRYSADFEGYTYYFTSQENLDLFVEDPERYIPAYGGYCAYAVAKGSTASVDPEQWVIHNGTLYLNFNAGTQRSFLGDLEGFIQQADQNWPQIKDAIENP
jgi:YHS domain-containing protein